MLTKNIRRLSPCLVAILLFLSAVSVCADNKPETPPPQKSESPFQFDGGTQYDISNEKDTFELRLPFTFKQGVTGVNPQPVSVSIGGLRDASLMKFFKVTMENATGGVRVLIVTIYAVCHEQGDGCRHDDAAGGAAQGQSAKPATLAQGKYELLIDMLSGQPEPSLVKLTLTLSAASLEAPATLPVRQEVPFWGTPDTTGALLLTEKSVAKTRLTDINIKQVGITGGADETTTAELQFSQPPELVPNGTARVTVSPSSAFPLGKTSGRLTIISPQLAQPQIVNFEVTARRPRWIILVCIITGLIIGFLVRTWSVQRIALNEARVNAKTAADALAKEKGSRPDSEFVRRVEPARKKLDDITSRTSADEIKKLIDAANAALDGAVQDFDQRRSAAQDAADSLKRLTETNYQLPANIAAPLAESKKAVEEAERQIEANDIVTAQGTLDKEVSSLGARLGQPTTDWRLQTKSFLDALTAIAPLLPSTASGSFTQDVATAQSTLDAIEPTAEAATIQQIESMLGEVHAARAKVRELVARGQLLLKTSRVSIEKVTAEKAALAGLTVPEPEKVTELIKNFDNLVAGLAAQVEQPEVGAETLPGSLSDLKAQWREVLLAQITSDADAHKAASDLFDADRYVDATESVAQSLPEPKKESLLGDAAPAQAAQIAMGGLNVGDIINALAGTRGRDLPVLTVLRTVRERSTPLPLDNLQVPSLAELLLLKLVRFVVAAALITAAGYFVFADKFIGTPLDLLTIIVWAFGMNVSVDTILDGQEVKKLLKVPDRAT